MLTYLTLFYQCSHIVGYSVVNIYFLRSSNSEINIKNLRGLTWWLNIKTRIYTLAVVIQVTGKINVLMKAEI